jgi:hypothetical protein
VMGVLSWLKGEKVLYYPGCVRNKVSQGRFAVRTLRCSDASLFGRFAVRGLSSWRNSL